MNMIYKITSHSYVEADTEAAAVIKFWDEYMTVAGGEDTSIESTVLDEQAPSLLQPIYNFFDESGKQVSDEIVEASRE